MQVGKKLKYEDIKQEVVSLDWKLLSDSYTNLKTQMLFECPNGHENYYTMEYWRRHPECPICKSNKYFQMNDKAPKSKGFRILAFDQASIVSGWSVFDDNILIKFGHHESIGTSSVSRISKTKAWVASMIQMWKPDLIIFEDIQLQTFDGNEQVIVFKKLAHLQGVLKNYCYETGNTYKIVPPATWRHYNKVKGRSRTDKKKSAQLIVKELYDLNVTQDEADALLIGRWAVHDQESNKEVIF